MLSFISFLILFPLSSAAQSGLGETEIRFEHLSGAHGLSQNTVTSIVQDQAGFMWFGTVNGLNRFDGYTFRVFKQNPSDPTSLSNNYVETLWKDHRGDLWVGTPSVFC